MAESAHVAPKGPEDWIEVADRELKNLIGAYHAHQSHDVKVDLALKATEAVLKAIVWKHEGWAEWPKKGNKSFKFLFGHNLEAMLDHTGLRTRLRAKAEYWASWRVLVNAGERQARYSPNAGLPTESETNEVAKAARHPDTGIVPWLLKRYREMI